jgi:hypothetical protein
MEMKKLLPGILQWLKAHVNYLVILERDLWKVIDVAIGDVQEEGLDWSLAKQPHNRELIELCYENALILKLSGVDESGLDEQLGNILKGDEDDSV